MTIPVNLDDYPFMPNGLSNLYQSDKSISNFIEGFCFHFYSNFDKILLANSENPDKMTHFMASGLVLHCLPMYYKKKYGQA